MVFRERFAPAQWLGFVAIVVGLVLFFASQLAAIGREIDLYLVGVAWIAFAALTWAIYGLAQKQLLHVLSSQGVMLCIYVGCALCFAPGPTRPRSRASRRGAGASCSSAQRIRSSPTAPSRRRSSTGRRRACRR